MVHSTCSNGHCSIVQIIVWSETAAHSKKDLFYRHGRLILPSSQHSHSHHPHEDKFLLMMQRAMVYLTCWPLRRISLWGCAISGVRKLGIDTQNFSLLVAGGMVQGGAAALDVPIMLPSGEDSVALWGGFCLGLVPSKV